MVCRLMSSVLRPYLMALQDCALDCYRYNRNAVRVVTLRADSHLCLSVLTSWLYKMNSLQQRCS